MEPCVELRAQHGVYSGFCPRFSFPLSAPSPVRTPFLPLPQIKSVKYKYSRKTWIAGLKKCNSDFNGDSQLSYANVALSYSPLVVSKLLFVERHRFVLCFA